MAICSHARYVGHFTARHTSSPRFGFMNIGVFVSSYKFILNSLPILLPEPVPPRARAPQYSRSHSNLHTDSIGHNSTFEESEDDVDIEAQLRSRNRSRHARLSVHAQAHQVWVRKKARRWYAVLAGALAGCLGIQCEKKSRRTGIAQQMFVR